MMTYERADDIVTRYPFVGLALGEQDMIRDIARQWHASHDEAPIDNIELFHPIARLGGAPLRRAIVAAHVTQFVVFNRGW